MGACIIYFVTQATKSINVLKVQVFMKIQVIIKTKKSFSHIISTSSITDGVSNIFTLTFTLVPILQQLSRYVMTLKVSKLIV